MKAPVVRREVNRPTAHQPRIPRRHVRLGGLVLGLSERLRLFGLTVDQRPAKHDIDFIVREILRLQMGPLLQHHHTQARGGKFLRHHTARRAGADHHEIDFVRRTVADTHCAASLS